MPTCYYNQYETTTHYTNYLELEFFYVIDGGLPLIQTIGARTRETSTDELVRDYSYCPVPPSGDSAGMDHVAFNTKNKAISVITIVNDG